MTYSGWCAINQTKQTNKINKQEKSLTNRQGLEYADSIPSRGIRNPPPK